MLYLWYMLFFFFNDTATTEIYTLSLHDALPILERILARMTEGAIERARFSGARIDVVAIAAVRATREAMVTRAGETLPRSEEHTSELQSRQYLVCRLLLEKKKKHNLTLDHHPMI